MQATRFDFVTYDTLRNHPSGSSVQPMRYDAGGLVDTKVRQGEVHFPKAVEKWIAARSRKLPPVSFGGAQTSRNSCRQVAGEARHSLILADGCQHRPNLANKWPHFAHTLPNLFPSFADVGRICPRFGQKWPTSAKLGQLWTKFGTNWDNSGSRGTSYATWTAQELACFFGGYFPGQAASNFFRDFRITCFSLPHPAWTGLQGRRHRDAWGGTMCLGWGARARTGGGPGGPPEEAMGAGLGLHTVGASTTLCAPTVGPRALHSLRPLHAHGGHVAAALVCPHRFGRPGFGQDDIVSLDHGFLYIGKKHKTTKFRNTV